MALASMLEVVAEAMSELRSAEAQVARIYPSLRAKVASEELRLAIEDHIDEMTGQIARIEQILRQFDMPAPAQRCAAMPGLVADVKRLVAANPRGAWLDAALVTALQKIEHFEIATYGSIVAHVEALGFDGPLNLLQKSLDEEKAMDARLTKIALDAVNPRALAADRDAERLASGDAAPSLALDRAAAGNKPRSTVKPGRN